MNRIEKNGEDNGFTLVEIMIAIMVFSIAMTLLFSTFNAFVSSSTLIKNSIRQTDKIGTVFNRIFRDLEALYVVQLPRYAKPDFNTDPDPHRFFAHEETVGGTPVSVVSFSTSAHARTGADPRNGVARVIYYVKENSARGLDLFRADVLAPFPEDIVFCNDPVICRDIGGFQVRFTDADGEEYTAWDSDDPAFSYAFPLRMDVTIMLGSGDTLQEFTASVAPAAARGTVE